MEEVTLCGLGKTNFLNSFIGGIASQRLTICQANNRHKIEKGVHVYHHQYPNFCSKQRGAHD